MKNRKLFNDVTEKLYTQIKSKKDSSEELKGTTHPTNLDVVLDKEIFTADEWTFLVENEEKFKYTTDINNGNDVSYPVYKVDKDKLYSNERNVVGIKEKYNEQK